MCVCASVHVCVCVYVRDRAFVSVCARACPTDLSRPMGRSHLWSGGVGPLYNRKKISGPTNGQKKMKNMKNMKSLVF